MIRQLRAITRTVPPPHGLLAVEAGRPGAYTDAFRADIGVSSDLAALVEAFFTTPAFRAERAALGVAGFSGRDADAAAMARGATDRFAVWQVAERGPCEILLRDVTGRTATWLAVEATRTGTALWLGSLVVPAMSGGAPRLGLAARTLLGPHRLYSRVLLAAAAHRLDGIEA